MMLYLGIDPHRKQLTMCVREEQALRSGYNAASVSSPTSRMYSW